MRNHWLRQLVSIYQLLPGLKVDCKHGLVLHRVLLASRSLGVGIFLLEDLCMLSLVGGEELGGIVTYQERAVPDCRASRRHSPP
jgi:hypothetical protein